MGLFCTQTKITWSARTVKRRNHVGLSENGFNPDEVLALSNDDALKSTLKENTEIAIQRGVFSAPEHVHRKPALFRSGSTRLCRASAALN